MFDAMLPWRAMDAAGMLVRARVTYDGTATAREVKVAFKRPDVEILSGSGQSTEFEIEYVTAELPELREDDQVVICDEVYGESLFRVRRPPYVDPEGPADGVFMKALLSRATS